MAQLISSLYLFVTLGLAFTWHIEATTYTVGDSSGWDISTNLDTWTEGKTFVVGDLLLFQYSSTNSLDVVTKQSYDSCNTTNVLNSYTNGNTTIPLTAPGPWYFVCGNKLYCLGGMKLQVNVVNNQTNSPVGAPQAQPEPGDTTQPSSKSNSPHSSAGSGQGGMASLVTTAFLGFLAIVSLVVQI